MDLFAPDRRYTLADLLATPELDRYELICGIPCRLSDGHLVALPDGVLYTAEDLWAMPENGLFELHRGKLRKLPYLMDRHQTVLGEIARQVTAHLRGQHAIGREIPYLVMPFATPETPYEKIRTVLQPDFCAILDRSKRTEMGCMGAPDLVVEVTSQGAEDMDFGEKLDLYEAAGVREYWIVDPYRKEATVCVLEHGKYRRQVYRAGNVPVAVFPPLEIHLDAVLDVWAVD